MKCSVKPGDCIAEFSGSPWLVTEVVWTSMTDVRIAYIVPGAAMRRRPTASERYTQ